MRRVRRRALIFAAVLVAAPLCVIAQSAARVARVGVLSPRSRLTLDADPMSGFLQGMRNLGYIEGKNVQFEWRFAEGDYARLPDLAADLVKLNVDVLLVGGNPAAQAAKKATSTIPIVVGSTSSPLAFGLVSSLARPGGNITGVSTVGGELGPKHLELLMATVPKLHRVAVLVNPANAMHAVQLRNLQSAAQRKKVAVATFEARTAAEIGEAFFHMRNSEARALIVTNDSFLIQQQRLIAREALRIRLPAASTSQQFADAGGLMSYGPDLSANYRRAADYVDKILKGAKPGELPFEEPREFFFVVNLDTAKALHIKVPQRLLVSANRLIGTMSR